MIFSILLVLLLGILANKLFTKLRLPGLLGMILVGVVIGPYVGNLLSEEFLSISTDIRNMALILILLRAGLGINKEVLKKVGVTALKMSFIPCLLEGAVITLVGHFLFNMPLYEAGILGFILAAVSPAVIVPAMISMKEQGLGEKRGIATIILAGSSIDDIFSITIFTVFLGLSTSGEVSIGKELIGIPIEIIGGIVLGLIIGIIIVKVFKKFKFSILEETFLLVSMGFLIYVIGNLINVSGLLGVMTLGFMILEKSEEKAKLIESSLSKLWFIAQIFLFVLIGAAVNVKVAFGAGAFGIAIIAIGLIGRSIGVIIALLGSNLNRKEKLFTVIAYTPKATVQAALGAVPLASGVASGELILAVAVMAIIITAPLGAIAIKGLAPKLLKE
ncbi:sodium/proton antiporter, CPA1 family [Clostridium collagenovorans DSM 3089]|uniref:Sodium/proton antiporter, CPA1 family n=1 Tax=Clostridium collagenovorans DSM 3089 TaxID=1121306 RepID=A0A1M5VUS1_9CLOT|nr:cation:proton antiporter [Clostridium collagenovorans]SHH78957.1 sodium/proton antiporter, CPA1 family [Clostridium collagenovorans DSM 3089]